MIDFDDVEDYCNKNKKALIKQMDALKVLKEVCKSIAIELDNNYNFDGIEYELSPLSTEKMGYGLYAVDVSYSTSGLGEDEFTEDRDSIIESAIEDIVEKYNEKYGIRVVFEHWRIIVD